MKLGITFSVFSGLELLKPSLINVRPFAHYITVVWSKTSTTGDPAPAYLIPLLNSLVEEDLIDELVCENPKVSNNPCEMQMACLTKREIGRRACQRAGCTHHLIKDCDEFHDPVQFKAAMEKAKGFDCTLSMIREFVGNPTTQLKAISGLYVPFIHPIDKPLKARERPFRVICDGGRTMGGVSNWYIFKPEELLLDHYTFVRFNEEEMKRKYMGHGHCHRIGTLNQFLQWTNRFKPEELVTVEDKYGIQAYWDMEFWKWLATA
jgi:hypothetical protein